MSVKQNPLLALYPVGQSVWLDNISRRLITSGELDRLIRDDGLRGVTSNPTIFQKAIGGSTDYDALIKRLAGGGKSPEEILDAIIIEDIQMATDRFRSLFDETKGGDGFVSIEVAPQFAHDTQRTIAEARRLARLVNRPNVMVKIPGTREGLPAIQQMIAEGYNINITLLFAIERHEEVMDAYLSGLEQRVREGKPLKSIASVASFFVSRIDTAVDKQLEEQLKTTTDAAQRARLEALRGQAAIANAKLAYQRFKKRFQQERFQRLQAQGAREQRVLWASTSAKDPRYADVRYVEELIGPHTVNTMPDATLAAFRDHGTARGATVNERLEDAARVLEQLAAVGISLQRITQELEEAGVKSFTDSFTSLLRSVAAKRELVAT